MIDRRPHIGRPDGLAPPALHLHKARVAEVRARGIDVIDMGSADTRHTPPEAVTGRVLDRLAADRSTNLYGTVPGVEALRDALGLDLGVPAANVFITAGANNGVVLALLALTQTGAAVAMPVPYFFNHAAQAELLGLDIEPVQTSSANGHVLSADDFATAMALDIVCAGLLSNPRNPTATLLDARRLTEIARAAGKPLIIDESYREFGGAPLEAPWHPDGNAIRVGSLSKSFGLAGWRIGYMIVPGRWMDAVLRAQDALMIHAAIPSQLAALEALTYRRTDDYVARYAAHIGADQARFRERLETLPWVAHVTGDVATFLWVTLRAGTDAERFAARLLQDHGIGVLAGGAFGGSEAAFRLGIASVASEDLQRAWDRLRAID